MHLTFVGPGRLGRSLHHLAQQAGHQATLVGRDLQLPAASDLIVLTVPDHAIHTVAQALPLGTPVVHTSGATDLHPVAHHPEHGSLHPLMTFPGLPNLPDLTDVPAALAGTPHTVACCRQLALDLGMRPVEVPGDRRLYHAAAVLAGNAATVLLAEAGEVLAHAGLAPRDARTLLLPLALRSLQNAVDDPREALTGPVARGDETTLQKHQNALSEAGLDDQSATYAWFLRVAQRLLGRA